MWSDNKEYKAFVVWDIETSVDYREDGKPFDTWLSYGVIGVYTCKWGMPLYHKLFTTWDELRTALSELTAYFCGRTIIAYAHNFAFEGDFLLKNVGRAQHIVANGKHRPISLQLVDFPNIDFRCSWKLLDKSVAKIGEEHGFPKLKDDYRRMERGERPTEEKVRYCMRDCDVVALGIADLIKEYGGIWRLPLTKTGIVRNLLKDNCHNLEPRRDWDFLPPAECWDAMRGAFYGGITISNPEYTGVDVKGVWSFDMSSAYPFAALSEKYPRYIEVGNPLSWTGQGDFWIAKLRIYGIFSRYPWGWLPSSRVSVHRGAILFNGKVIESEWIELYCCGVDFRNISETYTFDRVECLEYYPLSGVDRLPPSIYNLFEDLAGEKQDAKKRYNETKSEADAIVYRKKKERFNSLYGMLVQSIENEEYTVNERGEWFEEEIPFDTSKKRHINRNYLFGVYITAYTRANLLRFARTNGGPRVVYMDTDGCKFLPTPGQIVINTNAEKMKLINREKCGNLGEWEREDYETGLTDPVTGKPIKTDTIAVFRTYGAKKYWYRCGKKNHITVAGLPQKYNRDNERPIECKSTDFRLGHEWKRVKLARSFLYFGKAVTIDETLAILSEIESAPDAGGVALYPVSYTLNITEADKLYILYRFGRVIK